MRGATGVISLKTADRIFQSTLLMRGATLEVLEHDLAVFISIHAPHARSDLHQRGHQEHQRYFNPRSSCEERLDFIVQVSNFVAFQSTLLMRGATLADARTVAQSVFQSTLLMRGATVSILGIDLPDFIIYFSRTYPISPKMPTSRHLSCKLHFLCDGTSHFGDL